jgi:hypothetical protein
MAEAREGISALTFNPAEYNEFFDDETGASRWRVRTNKHVERINRRLS